MILSLAHMTNVMENKKAGQESEPMVLGFALKPWSFNPGENGRCLDVFQVTDTKIFKVRQIFNLVPINGSISTETVEANFFSGVTLYSILKPAVSFRALYSESDCKPSLIIFVISSGLRLAELVVIFLVGPIKHLTLISEPYHLLS